MKWKVLERWRWESREVCLLFDGEKGKGGFREISDFYILSVRHGKSELSVIHEHMDVFLRRKTEN